MGVASNLLIHATTPVAVQRPLDAVPFRLAFCEPVVNVDGRAVHARIQTARDRQEAIANRLAVQSLNGHVLEQVVTGIQPGSQCGRFAGSLYVADSTSRRMVFLIEPAVANEPISQVIQQFGVRRSVTDAPEVRPWRPARGRRDAARCD